MFRHGTKVCFLILHVDDLIAAADSPETIHSLMNQLSKEFKMKDLGEPKHFLGIEISNDGGKYSISQSSYIESILLDSGLADAKDSKQPLDPGYYKLDDKELLPDNKEYRKLIGKLLYLSTNTRPDITFPVGVLAQKVESPRQLDLNEVKRVIRYLKHTKDLKLNLYGNNTINLHAYSDANFAEERSEMKSNSGVACFLFGGLVSW